MPASLLVPWMRRRRPQKVRRSTTTEAPQHGRDLALARARYLAADPWRTCNARDAGRSLPRRERADRRRRGLRLRPVNDRPACALIDPGLAAAPSAFAWNEHYGRTVLHSRNPTADPARGSRCRSGPRPVTPAALARLSLPHGNAAVRFGPDPRAGTPFIRLHALPQKRWVQPRC